MDIGTLKESLQRFNPEDYEWKFVLYCAHKTRDGMELQFHLCKMKGIASLTASAVEFMLTKALDGRDVEAYSPFLPKESVGALKQDDELIREQLFDALLNIKNGVAQVPEDFVSGAIPKPVGYGFCGSGTGGEVSGRDVLFLRRANPFIAGKNAVICGSVDGGLAENREPVLKLTHAADFLLIDGCCYFLSAGIEKDFCLENRHMAICARRMAAIAGAAVVSDYDRLESEAMAAKHLRKFVDFDQKILEHIARLSIMDRLDFLGRYGITLDNEGRMDTADAEQCGLVIDLLCCRSCIDPLGRLSTAENITPR